MGIGEESDSNDLGYRRGIPAARSFLWVAKISLERFLAVYRTDPSQPYDEVLYYGSFWLFAKASLEALAKSDGRADTSLDSVQAQYFMSIIKPDPVFAVLADERNRIGHGDDSWASHPFLPDAMIVRFLEQGFDLFEISKGVWPDGPFQGQPPTEVMKQVWRQLSKWLDEVDILDSQAYSAKRKSGPE